MFDDPGDIDRNGIPDAIQRDPVVVPDPPPVTPTSILVDPWPGDGLPGITAPIEEPEASDASPTPPGGPGANEVIRALGEALSTMARKE
jgi:hypothetical protein